MLRRMASICNFYLKYKMSLLICMRLVFKLRIFKLRRLKSGAVEMRIYSLQTFIVDSSALNFKVLNQNHEIL